ncbi:MAG: HAD family phosphatase [Treponema sp.]|nr:HAD family phosphatase [Treponema sp.]
MSIKAVAFDYGGVIAFFQDADAMKDMADMAGIDESLMKKIYWDNRSIYDQGLVDGIGFYKHILTDIGVFADPDLLEKLIVRDMESWSHVNPKSEKLIRELKTSGIKLGILSNMVQDFLDRIKDTLPVFDLMDTNVFSCEVGRVKPDNKIYGILLSRLGCKAEELVFFDDLELNVNAALAMGIHSFLWTNPEEARKDLELLGVF